jgi:hypothetical protein
MAWPARRGIDVLSGPSGGRGLLLPAARQRPDSKEPPARVRMAGASPEGV